MVIDVKFEIGVKQARKALRALKGLVRLQAIVRGRAVRRRLETTLKCLPSKVKKQSEVLEKEDLGEKEIMVREIINIFWSVNCNYMSSMLNILLLTGRM